MKKWYLTSSAMFYNYKNGSAQTAARSLLKLLNPHFLSLDGIQNRLHHLVGGDILFNMHSLFNGVKFARRSLVYRYFMINVQRNTILSNIYT